MWTLTDAGLAALCQVERLHPVLVDVQVESVAHVERLAAAGVRVADPRREQTHGAVAFVEATFVWNGG